MEAEVMGAEQVAVFLGVDRKTVYEYASRGRIPHRRLGRRLLFSRAALLVWLEGRDTVRPCKVASARRGA